MKKLLVFFFLILSTIVKSQDTLKVITKGKNIIHYKSDLISESLIQDKEPFASDKQKVIYDRVIGIDVNIYVDTIFKKYTVSFTNDEGEVKIMNFKYFSAAFPNEEKVEEKPGRGKLYLMEFNGNYFYLFDFMDVIWSKELEITYNKKLANNRTWFYTIKNVKKVYK